MRDSPETARDDDAAASDGSHSKDSADVDDLSKNDSVERRLGWWRSLMSENPAVKGG